MARRECSRRRPAAAAAPTDGPPVAGFLNVAENIKDGLPLKPDAQELFKARREANAKDNPEAHCLPMGLMQFHTQGAPRKFIQTPGLTVILYEASMGIRQIFTDGADRRAPMYIPGGTAIPSAAGKATPSSSKPPAFATTAGSTCSARR